MKRLIQIALFLLLSVVMSCEEDMWTCDDCLDTIPHGAYLKINLNHISRTEPFFHITLFRGKIEDGVIVDERETYSTYSVFVNLNQEYSALLTQMRGDIEYRAVDATTIKAVSHEDYCEKVCYIIEGNNINLKFKYY